MKNVVLDVLKKENRLMSIKEIGDAIRTSDYSVTDTDILRCVQQLLLKNLISTMSTNGESKYYYLEIEGSMRSQHQKAQIDLEIQKNNKEIAVHKYLLIAAGICAGLCIPFAIKENLFFSLFFAIGFIGINIAIGCVTKVFKNMYSINTSEINGCATFMYICFLFLFPILLWTFSIVRIVELKKANKEIMNRKY